MEESVTDWDKRRVRTDVERRRPDREEESSESWRRKEGSPRLELIGFEGGFIPQGQGTRSCPSLVMNKFR